MPSDKYFTLLASTPELCHLISLPYLQRRRLLWKLDSRWPRFVYKYFGSNICRDDGEDRLRDLVVKSRVWLASPSSFNDPFDCQAQIEIPNNLSEIEKYMDDLWRRENPQLLWKKRRSMFNEIRKRPEGPRTYFYDLYQTTFKKRMAMVGVFSVSLLPRQLLMWSHYAAQHKGVCCIFESARDLSTWGKVISVDYRDDFPTANFSENDPLQYGNVLMRKSTSWSYEKEHRIIAVNGANHYSRFEPSSLYGIILGARLGTDSLDVVKLLLQERDAAGLPKIEVFKASMNPKKYQLTLKRISI